MAQKSRSLDNDDNIDWDSIDVEAINIEGGNVDCRAEEEG